MKEITHSIYCDPGGLFAGIRNNSSLSFFDRRGLERLIYAQRARARDTGVLEDRLTALVTVEQALHVDAI